MTQPRRIALQTWARLTYGDDAPSVKTLRRWAREGKIWPQPVKHGRSYFVDPSAEYVATRRTPTHAPTTIREAARLARLSLRA